MNSVIPSANTFHLNCYTATIFTTEAVDFRGLTLIGVLLTVAEGERRRGHDFFLVLEACKGGLLR
jgi:hypothetical protein